MRTHVYNFQDDIEAIFQDTLKTTESEWTYDDCTIDRFIIKHGYSYSNAIKRLWRERVIYTSFHFPNPRLIADLFVTHQTGYLDSDPYNELHGYLLTNRGEAFIDKVLKLRGSPLRSKKCRPMKIPLNYGFATKRYYYK